MVHYRGNCLKLCYESAVPFQLPALAIDGRIGDNILKFRLSCGCSRYAGGWPPLPLPGLSAISARPVIPSGKI
jgi:hypothetical protein